MQVLTPSNFRKQFIDFVRHFSLKCLLRDAQFLLDKSVQVGGRSRLSRGFVSLKGEVRGLFDGSSVTMSGVGKVANNVEGGLDVVALSSWRVVMFVPGGEVTRDGWPSSR